jgi:NAD(P)H-quinone oxidoreductase subunit 5
MLDPQRLITWLGVLIVTMPALVLIVLSVASILKWQYTEQTINQIVRAMFIAGLLACIAVLALMLAAGTRHVVIRMGELVEIPGYHFSVKFVFDRLSVPMAILSYLLTGTIGAFASSYMHRERGYNRFFVLLSLFVLGMIVASLADTIETLFVGWEFVGLSSALLVAYYQDRPAPARNGLWVWIVYRFSDAALLLAAVVLHHMAGQGDFDRLLGDGPWPDAGTSVPELQAFVVGSLLLVAAAGKSGMVPFSGWLPRAMEGPTPTSAIFYGALSVHLGVFLLLRISPLLENSLGLCVLVVALGLVTAAFAHIAASVQTDVKSALCFACLAQVGLIVAEIGLGLRYIALVHLLGNACLRTLQFLRAPTLLRDYRTIENAIGEHLPRSAGWVGHLIGARLHAAVYRWALDRGCFDWLLLDYVVYPFISLMRWCDAMERRWTNLLSSEAGRASDRVKPLAEPFEELS